MSALNDIQIPIPKDDSKRKQCQVSKDDDFDYSQRGQWLRAAVFGANDGLVSVASLMMGIGAVKEDIKAKILTDFAGACSMAIGEVVSVHSQLDVEVAQMKKEKGMREKDEQTEKEQLSNPMQSAVASALAFTLGALMPLLAASSIVDHKERLSKVVAAVNLALVVFGAAGAILGSTPVVRSCFRVAIGGWMAIAITFGLTKLIGSSGL